MADTFTPYDYIPYSDLEITDETALTTYNTALNSGNVSTAVAGLDTASVNKGFRAAVINAIETKTKELEAFLLNMANDDPNTYYSAAEPTDAEIGTKQFWVQIL